MFRRKEEGLFDTDTDQNQMLEENSQEEKSANQTTSSFGSSSSSTGSTFTSSAPSQQPAASQAPARPSAPAPSANSFRPAAATPASSSLSSTSADMARARASEAKPIANPISAAADKAKPGQRVLTVGNDILLKGEIATCDRLVIEGKVDATLNDVHTVEIAECGSFKGAAQIEDAEISGLFEGELIVRGRLVIYATGKVRGKISYGEIEIERGGELTGEIKMTGATASNARPASRNVNKEEKVAA